MEYGDMSNGVSLLDDFHPGLIEVQRVQDGLLGQQRRLLDSEFQRIVRNNRVNGELGTVRLPGKTHPARFKVLSYQISVIVYLPYIIACPVPMVFFFIQTIRKQVVASDEDGSANWVIIVLRYIDSFIPNAQDSSSSLLDILVRVSDAV